MSIFGQTQTGLEMVGVRTAPRQGRFMTLIAAGQELGCSTAQVYTMVHSGDLPAIRIGDDGPWRVERAALEQYIAPAREHTRERRLTVVRPVTDLENACPENRSVAGRCAGSGVMHIRALRTSARSMTASCEASATVAACSPPRRC